MSKGRGQPSIGKLASLSLMESKIKNGLLFMVKMNQETKREKK